MERFPRRFMPIHEKAPREVDVGAAWVLITA